jgi:hypothetical protein
MRFPRSPTRLSDPKNAEPVVGPIVGIAAERILSLDFGRDLDVNVRASFK